MVILISGKQGSGKTTLTKALTKRFNNKTHIVKFADVLYEIHDFALSKLQEYGIQRDIKKDGPLLQLLGTEWGRQTIDDNIWVKVAQSKVKNIKNLNSDLVVIIDDCRFKNELLGFTDALLVRLECPKEIRKPRCEMWRDRDNHQSEIDLDDWLDKFDLVFDTSKVSVNEIVERICLELVSKAG